jgi:CheY-like chemotaxis protein
MRRDRPLILAVDDEPANLALLRKLLTRQGYDVTEARDGPSAIRAVAEERPDLVCLDVMMPGLDGIDTIRIVRQLEGYRDLPIVAVTAKAMVGDREKCIEAGATDYVAKPVNMDVLLSTLWRCLNSRETA